MLKLEHVSKIYHVGTFGGKELHAVDDVSFEVAGGEVTALIGESGSGKSTIGKMILRLIPITAGAIHVGKVDVATLKGAELKEYYRRVQGVFQDPFSSYNPIFKAERVFKMVRDEFFPAMPEAEWRERLNRSLQAVGLDPEQVLGKYPHQLSGGQLQRLLIARALLLDVQLLVADEIISMLDASTRIDVLNLLAELTTHGLSILFITHDLSLGYYISEKAVILYRGCIVEMGSTDAIYHRPQHPYTKMLMASVPRLDKKWEEVEGEVETQIQQGAARGGCVYYARCPMAEKDESCLQAKPALRQMGITHVVACCKLEGMQTFETDVVPLKVLPAAAQEPLDVKS